jgi:hypothetical protein
MGVLMRRCRGGALGGLALLALYGGLGRGAAAETPSHAAKLSAEQIIAKNAAARGGLDAWRKVQTMIWVGHIESAHAPQGSMLFELQQQRPNKTRLEITAHGQKTVRVFDGSQGWKLRTAQSGAPPTAQPYTTEELRFARGGQGVDGPLIDAAARGNLVTLGGLDEIDGRKAWRLDVRLPGGERDQLWIDAKTFLDIRCDRVTDGPGPAGLPRHIVSLIYRDYRSFDGLRIPSIIESAAGAGGPPDRMVIERVLVNTPLDQRAFVMPSAPHPRFRTLPGNAGAPSSG